MKIIKISAIWCPSCIIMNNVISDLANEINFELVEYDYDFDEEVVKEYNPGKILPVMIVLKDDHEVLRIIGEKTKKEILDLIKEV